MLTATAILNVRQYAATTMYLDREIQRGVNATRSFRATDRM